MKKGQDTTEQGCWLRRNTHLSFIHFLRPSPPSMSAAVPRSRAGVGSRGPEEPVLGEWSLKASV